MRQAILSAIVGLSACADPPCPTPPLGDDPLPLAVGNFWVYDESGGPVSGTVTKTVTGIEDFAALDTFVWETRQTNSPVVKRSNWHDDGERVVRLRQERYDQSGMLLSSRVYQPGFLRYDRTLDEVGEELIERHTRLEYDAGGNLIRTVSKRYQWRVEAVDELITVPVGEFACVRVRRTDVDSGADFKTYWYARGVGKVNETDPLETEALAEFSLAP